MKATSNDLLRPRLKRFWHNQSFWSSCLSPFASAIKRYGLLSVAVWVVVSICAATQPIAATMAMPATCDWSHQQYEDFYTPPSLGAVTPARLGEVLRVEHIVSFTPDQVSQVTRELSNTFGAEAYRILFLSQDAQGNPQAVSGILVTPIAGAQSPLSTTFPLLVYGHGSVGLADQCAPSRHTRSLIELLRWVRHGLRLEECGQADCTEGRRQTSRATN